MNCYGLPDSNVVESIYLEQMLDTSKFSASYKILWLYAIYKEIISNKTEASILRLVSRMVGIAWYPILYYRLNFGVQDRMSGLVFYVHNNFKIDRDEKEENVAEFIYSCNDKILKKKINDISLYVQYRLIRPLYDKYIKEKERLYGRKLKDNEINTMITELSNTISNPLYSIDKKNKKIIFGQAWSEYIKKNQSIIEGWIKYKLIYYLQTKNPNVPAIPFKIYPPMKRDLKKAKNYWSIISEEMKFNDIYSMKDFKQGNLDKYGDISIDHFIPWSFVLHDEMWNLVPTFKNINSSKSNNLPDLNLYYDKFCELQYNAFVIARNSKRIKLKVLEDYLTINKDIFSLNLNDYKSKDIFIDSLKKTISPLYQIASNQGYGFWNWKGVVDEKEINLV